MTAVFAAVLVAVAPGVAVPASAESFVLVATGRVDVVVTFGGQPVGQLAVLVTVEPQPGQQLRRHELHRGRRALRRCRPPGNYDVHVAEYPGSVLYGSQVVYEVAVPDGGRALDLAFELTSPRWAITGQVADPDGTPAVNVQI